MEFWTWHHGTMESTMVFWTWHNGTMESTMVIWPFYHGTAMVFWTFYHDIWSWHHDTTMVVLTFYHGTVSIVHGSIILLWYVLWYFGHFTMVLVNWKCTIALPSYFTQFTIIAMIFYTWYHLTMVLLWYF